jgi:hypothetical protein
VAAGIVKMAKFYLKRPARIEGVVESLKFDICFLGKKRWL